MIKEKIIKRKIINFNFKKFMEENELTQHELAKKIGITQGTLSHLCNLKLENTKIETLEKVYNLIRGVE